MDATVPWDRLVALIEPFYYADRPGKRGRKAKPIETLPLADLGVEPGDFLKTTTYAPPAKRSKGIMVKTAAELVDALKQKGLL